MTGNVVVMSMSNLIGQIMSLLIQRTKKPVLSGSLFHFEKKASPFSIDLALLNFSFYLHNMISYLSFTSSHVQILFDVPCRHLE